MTSNGGTSQRQGRHVLTALVEEPAARREKLCTWTMLRAAVRSASRSASDHSRDGKLCGRYLYASASRSCWRPTRTLDITVSTDRRSQLACTSPAWCTKEV